MTINGVPMSGFAFLEERKKSLVDTLDGLEEFVDSHCFASYFVCVRFGSDGVAELRGAADAFGSQQGEYCLWILVPRLALLPLLNRPGCLSHIIHCIAEFPEDVGIYRGGSHVVFQSNKLRAGFP
jgi:hypothetical protein